MDLVKDELQPFDPRGPLHRWKLWVRVVTPDAPFYHFYWGRIGCCLTALMLGAWMAAAGGVWAFLTYNRGWEGAPYWDLVLYPVRRHEVHRGLGKFQLERGRLELKNKNYVTGYALSVAGLAKVPDDLGARRSVAIVQVQAGRLDRAVETLAEGLKYQPNLDYLKLTFGWMLETWQPERRRILAEGMLPARPTSELKDQFVALQVAHARFDAGRFEACQHTIQEWGLQNSIEGTLLLALVDWESGHQEDALRRLAAEVPRFATRDQLYMTLIRFYRELGRNDEARRFALLRQFNDPVGPGPAIDLLHGYHSSADLAAVGREIESYFARHGEDARALGLLAWFAVETAQPELLARVHAVASDRNLPAAEIHLARVQMALSSRNYAEAIRITDEIASRAETKAGYGASVLPALHAVAQIGAGNDTFRNLAVRAYVEGARLARHDTMLLARELKMVGAAQEARSVLERAYRLDPLAQPALIELVRLDCQLGNQEGLAEFLPRLLALHRPPRGLLIEALLVIDRRKHPELFERARAALDLAPVEKQRAAPGQGATGAAPLIAPGMAMGTTR